MTDLADGAETPQPGPLEIEALEHIRALIRIDSVNTGEAATIGDGETRAALYVKEHLDEVGYETVLVEPRPGRASVVARLAGSDPDAGALVAHAHLDVVHTRGLEHNPLTGRYWLTGDLGVNYMFATRRPAA